MRVIVRSALVLVVVVAVAIGVAVYYLDSLAARAIEVGGEASLGVKTEVGSVSIGLLSGRFSIEGLRIYNPEGFGSDVFLEVRKGGAVIDLSQLRESRVGISEFLIDGVSLNLVYESGRANFAQFLQAGNRAPADEGTQASPIQVDLDAVHVREVEARLDLAALGRTKQVSVAVPELHVPIRKSRGGTATIGEIVAAVVRAVVQSSVRATSDLPGDVRAELQKSVADLQRMGRSPGTLGEASKVLEEQTRRSLGDLLPRGD